MDLQTERREQQHVQELEKKLKDKEEQNFFGNEPKARRLEAATFQRIPAATTATCNELEDGN